MICVLKTSYALNLNRIQRFFALSFSEADVLSTMFSQNINKVETTRWVIRVVE